jgi:hypothetical protein
MNLILNSIMERLSHTDLSFGHIATSPAGAPTPADPSTPLSLPTATIVDLDYFPGNLGT